jgi:ABC-type polar amino acid transport system ATPase subunit
MMLEARNITKTTRGVSILKDISVTFPAGKVVGIHGPSGCGKTTFLRCLSNLEPATTGSVSLIDPRKGSSLVKGKVTMLSQHYTLWPHLTVEQNIFTPLTYQKQPYTRKQVLDLVDRFGISGLLSRFPKALSGGQRQRVALLRAVSLNLPFLLLDEPSSALDDETTAVLALLLKEEAKDGKGIVLSSHDKWLLELATDYVMDMKEGVLSTSPRILRLLSADLPYPQSA